jgi:putative FmdB family regulatory protein
MPTYAYKCKDCGHSLEVHQGFSDPSLTECPVCGGRLRKQYGSVGITFNGSGFYRTDSRASGKGDGAGKPGGAKSDGASSDGASSDGGKTESKPAAKSDAPAAKPAASTGAAASS